MATQRYISTSFWDDEWVQELDPSEKLFYIYLLTNPLTNIAGVYKISDKRVAFDCGFSKEVIAELWLRFTRNNKAVRHGEWVIIPAWPRHQRYESRVQIRKGIDKVISELPDEVRKKMVFVGYDYPIDTLSEDMHKVLDGIDMVSEGTNTNQEEPTTYQYHPSYIDSDRDIDTDKEIIPSAPTALAPKQPPPLKDPVAQQWEQRLTSIQPMDTWANVGKERRDCTLLAKRATNMLGQSPYADMSGLIDAVLNGYAKLRDDAKANDSYWRTAPYTPSAILSRWAAIWTHLAEQSKRQEALDNIGDIWA